MAIEVREVEQRFEAVVGGEVAGFAEFRDQDGRRTFAHTVVDPRYQGQGVAGRLVGHALDATREAGLQVEPLCSFVRTFLLEHPEHLDLVPGEDRGRFDLPAVEGPGRA